MFCKIIPKLLLHKDICEISDDHNPGAFNVFKHCGKGVGILCLLLDVLKGCIPVLLTSLFMDTTCWAYTFVIAAPVLGHAVGTFNRFHGGKCIAVSFGVMFGILPVSWMGITVLAVLYILFSTAIKINPNTKRSIIVYSLFGAISCVLCAVLEMPTVAFGCLTVAVIAIVKHLKITEHIKSRLKINESASRD